MRRRLLAMCVLEARELDRENGLAALPRSQIGDQQKYIAVAGKAKRQKKGKR